MQSIDSKLLLSDIDEVFNYSRNVDEGDLSFDSVKHNLSNISEYFGISQRESFIFSVIFVLNFTNIKTSVFNLTEHFSTRPANVLLFLNELESLTQKGILRKHYAGSEEVMFGFKYSVNGKVLADLLENKAFSKETIRESDIYVLFEKIYKLIEDRDSGSWNTAELSEIVSQILKENEEIPFVSTILKLNLKSDSILVFIYVIWSGLTGNRETDANLLIYSIYKNASERVLIMQRLMDGSHELVRRGLIDLTEGVFLSDISLNASESTVSMAKKHGILLSSRPKSLKGIIKSSCITFKELIFNDWEISQLNTLKELLKQDCYKRIANKLKSNKLPEGITALFYGESGTGKTESVLQIALESKRDIMKVDISQTKSMWYGESEKHIKQVFQDYICLLKECPRTPILLINEADALISKRADTSYSSTKQTENSIQNIFLEEMENFKGILIATTNLVENFDKAYDRRFLYKVNFPETSQEIRFKIWKLKRPFLSDQECSLLASQFQFNGGQIDNVIRKILIDDVISNRVTPFEVIVEYCSSELIQRKGDVRKIVGF